MICAGRGYASCSSCERDRCLGNRTDMRQQLAQLDARLAVLWNLYFGPSRAEFGLMNAADNL